MAVTAFASGTQTCTIGTEHFLANVNVAGIFQLELDTSVLADGDVLEVREYQMLLTAGTARIRTFTGIYGAQPTEDTIKNTVPLMNELTDAQSLRYSIKQTFGTGRSVPWKVLRAA